MDLIRVDYSKLNAKQKENFNFHKVAAALADYGYDSMRLNNDWEGADFIAVKGDSMIKVQLKGRFTLSKKYIGKDLWIAFIENGDIKLYEHDQVIPELSSNITESKSWKESGAYSWGKTPIKYNSFIILLNS
ncbi:hypothetical protein PQY73_00260 [Schleiferiaceae bacterium]|jgi:hypothetical protein|nr:hypothetical protein [Schleiferiaceae bacterium]